jgi:hypothetical protein
MTKDGAPIKNSTKTLNRHGLIAGATGIRKQNYSSFISTIVTFETCPNDAYKKDFSGITREKETIYYRRACQH